MTKRSGASMRDEPWKTLKLLRHRRRLQL
jgi:hypothetical protein